MKWPKLSPAVFRRIILYSIIMTLLIIAAGFIGIEMLDDEISDRLKTREFLAPTTYWALPEFVQVKSVWPMADLAQLFSRSQYHQALSVEDLKPGTFFNRDCGEVPFKQGFFSGGPDLSGATCYYFRTQETLHPALSGLRMQAFAIRENGEVVQAFVMPKDGTEWKSADEVRIEPHRVAQFVEGKPLLQEWIPEGEIPTNCKNAVLAIEDPRFLEHAGVNWKGLARALVVNISAGRFRQGGSTITQQMVKNFFLNSEKTLSRKLKELGMSLVLERRLSKDEILQIYLNIIYLGQSGAFQIHGYSAASRHYFHKNLPDLELHECALLAAVLNLPGGYDPFRNPERALKRRNLVLNKMLEHQMISQDEFDNASKTAMPINRKPSVDESAPYFLEAVHRELGQTGQSLEGLNVFTTMNLRAQEVAQKSLVTHLQKLEKENEQLKKNAASGLRLEGIALSLELATGRIFAAVGGRGFRTSPFNRILDGRRQVGSLAKPFVYLTAFENDPAANPLTTIMDEKTEYKLYRQTWSPENYSKKFMGEVSFAYALKNSLNASTAALGMKTGLGLIVENLRRAGIVSPIDEVPAMTLGAIDLKPIEVVEAYITLARMGSHLKPRFYEALVDSRGHVKLAAENEAEQVLTKEATGMVVSMMREATRSGTSAAITRSGFKWPAAGKTGTTSDYRDAWFIGFTPTDLTMIWVGYDQNQSHGLTGSNGAVPVWLPIMNVVSEHRATTEFIYSDNLKAEQVATPPDTDPVPVMLRK